MTYFEKARPVWAKGREKEKNLTCGFRAVFRWNGEPALLRAAASSSYRFFVGGVFAGEGPARGPHGYYRVDEIDLSGFLKKGENILAVEVAGYNINSFSLLDQPAFLQAELTVGGKTLAATGWRGFSCAVLPQRVQKTQRYSFQRTFAESYRMTPETDAWRGCAAVSLPEAETEFAGEKALISRNLPPFRFPAWPASSVLETGSARRGAKPTRTFEDRSLKAISDKLKGYPENELEVHLTDEALGLATERTAQVGSLPFTMPENSYVLLDFGVNKTGFLGLSVSAERDTELYLLFDEVLSEGDVDFTRMGCCNVMKYSLKAGEYELLSFEPYTMKYLKVICLGGPCELRRVFLREKTCPVPITAKFSGDEKLRKIYDAAVESFRQNCTDIYMDCPSRERAGWLCDSFFTSRAECVLTGKSLVEHNFLENFMLPEKFEFLPDGMLPMCYPSDHNDGTFIPNWALWFVLELEEYKRRSGDKTLTEGLKKRVYDLFAYFLPFENEFGLLEGLKSWVFVEWSMANKLTQDVNFPTNMLYAAALDAAGRLYGDGALCEKAGKLRSTVRGLSFDGEFFVDNALRENGKLRLSGERTETCQYYAFFFDIASPKTFMPLWKKLTEDFGPQRAKTGAYPEIYPSNAFIGNYLRLDLLSRNGMREKMLEEMDGDFTYMAEKTGTLWENVGDYASCDHGFTSYAAYLLLQK